MDTAARRPDLVFPHNLPLFVSFDYGAAFPSLFHGFIEKTLALVGAEAWILSLFFSLYYEAAAFAVDGEYLFAFLVGVLQGDPWSSQLFIIAIDPFLNDLTARIDFLGYGITRACADDIGAVIFNIRYLLEYFYVFEASKVYASLCL